MSDYETKKEQIFNFRSGGILKLSSRENSWLEFKDSFNWANRAKYAKTLASFANRDGGLIVFGVRNSPRELTGLSSDRFEELDEAKITEYLNSTFSPELSFEKTVDEIRGKKVGILSVTQAISRPVIAMRNDSDISEGEIYYRYAGRTGKIRFPEMQKMINDVREIERTIWREHIERIAVVGAANAAVLDTIDGKISGSGGTLVIDKKLVPKLKFIREGRFSERGKPTLKLIGDVKPVAVSGGGLGHFRYTDDPSAPAVRVKEEEMLKNYPLTYDELTKLLRKRYKDFKASLDYHQLRKKLMKKKQFCVVRYLDPNKPSSTNKVFYSKKIIREFDKLYTRH